jgi:hypothetical protein
LNYTPIVQTDAGFLLNAMPEAAQKRIKKLSVTSPRPGRRDSRRAKSSSLAESDKEEEDLR